MRRVVVVLAILCVACTSGPDVSDSTSTSTTTIATTTSSIELRVCPPPPYEIGFLPLLVGDPDFDPTTVDPDPWTSVGGSYSTFVGRADGTPAIALIRGALPAIDWPGPKGIVKIDGVDAAVGPHDDGTWVAGWALDPAERCDLYTMVFYPPWNPQDVERVLTSMTRVPG